MLLKTSRLALRNYRPEDWVSVHSYACQPEFSRFEAWGPNSEEDTHKFISDMLNQSLQQPRYAFDLAVCLADTNQLVGGCGIRKEVEHSLVANLGWAIHPDFQRQGYATEAARALIRFGFEHLHLLVIYATCDARNIGSFRVMEKLGMRRAGCIFAHMEIKGHLRDTLRYEVTREMFNWNTP